MCMSVFHMDCHDTIITDADIVYRNRFRCSKCMMRAPILLPNQNVKSRRSSDADFAGFSAVEITNFDINNKTEQIEVNGQLENAGQLDEAAQQKNAVHLDEASQVQSDAQSPAENKADITKPTDRVKYALTFGVPYSEEVPDASYWTPDDVYKYFCQYFDRNVAIVFKEQEIDGIALLLFKRTDALTQLHMKLGTAVKIYSHILRLQTRVNDIRLGWF